MCALTSRHDEHAPILLPSEGASLYRQVAPRPQASFRRTEDRQFLTMEWAFRRTGGLSTGDEVAQLLRRRLGQPISTLARWIVDREILVFNWQARMLVPMFQFEPSDMSLRHGPVAVVRELVDVLDDWELALWFAQPNEWLNDTAPVDAITVDLASVLEAARADRFIAQG